MTVISTDINEEGRGKRTYPILQDEKDAKLLQDGQTRDGLDVQYLSERLGIAPQAYPHAFFASYRH